MLFWPVYVVLLIVSYLIITTYICEVCCDNFRYIYIYQYDYIKLNNLSPHMFIIFDSEHILNLLKTILKYPILCY